EVAQDALAAALRALHPGPHRAVLAPADARALLCGRAADRERPGVPLADQPAGDAIGCGRRRLDDTRLREMADDGAHRLLLVAAREQPEIQVVARRLTLGGTGDRAADVAQQIVSDRRALDEEHVQALVAAGREQQRLRRLAVAPRAAGLLVVG